MRAIIIDDEENAVRSLELILDKFCPDLQIIGSSSSSIEGVELIKKENPDLLFLDIEMPHLTGFDLLNLFPDRTFDVIFITAYNEYAIKAIKSSAVDYILKPVDIEELIAAVNKVKEIRKKSSFDKPDLNLLMENLNLGIPKTIALRTSSSIEYVAITSIAHAKADGSYTEIFLTGGEKLTVSKSLNAQGRSRHYSLHLPLRIKLKN